MSPIELLRNGISQQDWEQIIEGFKQLTGETCQLSVKTDKKKSSKKVTQKTKAGLVKKQKRSPNPLKTSSSASSSIVFIGESDYDDPRLEKPQFDPEDLRFDRDLEIDKKIVKNYHRRRSPVTLVESECVNCHKKYMITNKEASFYSDGSPESMKPSYFCSRCSGG